MANHFFITLATSRLDRRQRAGSRDTIVLERIWTCPNDGGWAWEEGRSTTRRLGPGRSNVLTCDERCPDWGRMSVVFGHVNSAGIRCNGADVEFLDLPEAVRAALAIRAANAKLGFVDDLRPDDMQALGIPGSYAPLD